MLVPGTRCGAPPGTARALLACALALSMIVAGATRADAGHAAPTGRVVLTISGNITHANQGDAAAFDQEMLTALGETVVRTATPWTDGEVEFRGPLVRDVLAAAGAAGDSVRAEAINDYAVEIPLADFQRFDVILAMSMNGTRLRTRNKGPLWIIYPWTDNPDLKTESVHGRSVWQLKRLIVQ